MLHFFFFFNEISCQGGKIPFYCQNESCHSVTYTFPAAAAAKSLQSCPTLCDPTDGLPPGSPVPGILQARTLEWVALSFSNAWKWKVKVKSLSHVRLLATSWTAAHQAALSMGFSRQEYWGGVPLPSPTPLLRTHTRNLQPPFFDFKMEGGGAGSSPSVVFRASIKASWYSAVILENSADIRTNGGFVPM